MSVQIAWRTPATTNLEMPTGSAKVRRIWNHYPTYVFIFGTVLVLALTNIRKPEKIVQNSVRHQLERWRKTQGRYYQHLDPTVLIYNRIPKAGSSTFALLLMRMCRNRNCTYNIAGREEWGRKRLNKQELVRCNKKRSL